MTDHIIEEVTSSLEGQIGICLDAILRILSVKIHFQRSLFPSRIHKTDD
jgi:hypothetical protein